MGLHILCKQVLRSMINVIIRKCCYGKITVVVVWLIPDIQPSINTGFLRGSSEVLREKLPLLIEVVAGSLKRNSIRTGRAKHGWD